MGDGDLYCFIDYECFLLTIVLVVINDDNDYVVLATSGALVIVIEPVLLSREFDD